MTDINWHNIRTHGGSQSKGFEELCAQLARAEASRAGSEFVRNGAPDAGVECYAVLENGEEWGWQAKYFNTIGDSQWKQIDESARRAIATYPNLVKYYVCVPLNLPDARRANAKSARDRWSAHTKKWAKAASKNGKYLEFVFWGDSELTALLSEPRNAGRRYFWFTDLALTADWFGRRLIEAIEAAGPRYTPELNVDLPIAADFDAFGRTAKYFDRIKVHARGIRRDRKFLQYPIQENSPADQAEKVLIAEVLQHTDTVLWQLEQIKPTPCGKLPFNSISDAAQSAVTAAAQLEGLLRERQNAQRSAPAIVGTPSAQRPGTMNSQGEILSDLRSLKGDLGSLRNACDDADALAAGRLFILSGDAGMGKTHLLCDIAKRRLDAAMPTLLLMGQRFQAAMDPWPQAMSQLGLATIASDVFIGAIEAAAQTANCRALILVDALNEGAGREIWPYNLAAFLQMIAQSPWIGVVLSIRSSYEHDIIPKEISEKAIRRIHRGFIGREYDATRSYFRYYKIQFSSTPLLDPEFGNPLFLKSLCVGLASQKTRRVPRGFHGVTKVFKIFIDAINAKLATDLGFDPKELLVHQALEAIASKLASGGTRLLTRGAAKEIVDAFLPGREFSKSLFRGLVAEALIIESKAYGATREGEEIIFIAYDRFADHLIGRALLDTNLKGGTPKRAFAQGGPFSFLWDKKLGGGAGLIEALCIQIPERFGCELLELAPKLRDSYGIGSAFRRSIVWRDTSAFTRKTKAVLNRLLRTSCDWSETFDTLITVATIPDHQYNAESLDRWLRRMKMPERDAIWSTFLHSAWRNENAVDRLVDWATAVDPDDDIEVAVVTLAATALAWMLSTPNRFLRDTATQALVRLLTGRFEAAIQLVSQFSDVDDPYIAERVYAVTYGVAMRSYDKESVGKLAEVVFEKLFANGRPRAHILLRDYARGVIERALFLGAKPSIDARKAKPPYRSDWPKIPSEEEISGIFPDWRAGSFDSGNPEWSRYCIQYSVLDDDFGRYIIGTNSSTLSHYWLSLRLDEPPWQSPDEITDTAVATLPERAALDTFLGQQRSSGRNRVPPGFDLTWIQRYVLWRVLDLGWTVKLFGKFDRFSVTSQGREAGKAERMGKKYQWIAYHEILAMISDNFQFRPWSSQSGGQSYDGPWQLSLRDIDPSGPPQSLASGDEDVEGGVGWWGAAYEGWKNEGDLDKWTSRCDDLPKMSALLEPREGSGTWLNLNGFFVWRQPVAADRDPIEGEKGQVFIALESYLVPESQIDAVVAWLDNDSFRTRRSPGQPDLGYCFLGEYGWSPAFRDSEAQRGADAALADETWPRSASATASMYRAKMSGFDCSVDKNYTLRLPANSLIRTMGLRWTGNAANFVDGKGMLTACDPAGQGPGPSALLVRRDALVKFLSKNKLAIFWKVSGAKIILGGEINKGGPQELVITGLYRMRGSELAGSTKFWHRAKGGSAQLLGVDPTPAIRRPSRGREEGRRKKARRT